jgi:hypothetical protein
MALSGVEEYLFIFGGTEDGSPSGEASNTAVRVNLDTREAGEMVFGEGENLPGHVEAARWRHQDRAVYFVTRTEENLELKKWEAMRNFAAAGAIQTLATFPSEWAELDDVSMDIAADGAILVSMDNGEFLRLAWFNTDLGSPLRYYGTYVAESMPLARSPMATPLGVVVFPEQDEPTLLSVPWSSFVVEGEQPVIH